MSSKVQQLSKKHRLTEREAEVVLAAADRTGQSVDALVAKTKADRCGPAAQWEAEGFDPSTGEVDFSPEDDYSKPSVPAEVADQLREAGHDPQAANQNMATADSIEDAITVQEGEAFAIPEDAEAQAEETKGKSGRGRS